MIMGISSLCSMLLLFQLPELCLCHHIQALPLAKQLVCLLSRVFFLSQEPFQGLPPPLTPTPTQAVFSLDTGALPGTVECPPFMNIWPLCPPNLGLQWVVTPEGSQDLWVVIRHVWGGHGIRHVE